MGEAIDTLMLKLAAGSGCRHDLVFYEKRSTPKVLSHGKEAPQSEAYGKQTSRRCATAEDEKVIASGRWLRVDQSGKKGGQPGYKKTKMKGREHLVGASAVSDELVALSKTFPASDFHAAHDGQKCSRWQHGDDAPAATRCREVGGKHLGACARHAAEMTK